MGECKHKRIGTEPCIACGGNRESNTKDPSSKQASFDRAFHTGWAVVKQTQQPGFFSGLSNMVQYGQPTAPDARYCQKCSQIKPQYAAQAGLNPNDPTSQWNMCRCGGA